MLAYFPIVYPDELLYSVLARFQRHIGMPSSLHLMKLLFGHKYAIASIDFQGFLHHLASEIPASRHLTPEKIIDALTVCPYYLAFAAPRLQLAVRQALVAGAAADIHLRLGITAFRIPRVTRLRFCPQCIHLMPMHQGELYWRRSHQLPSVLVCPTHGCRLLDSMSSPSIQGRHRFIAATPENCRPYAHIPTEIGDPVVNRRLHQIASRSADLLNTHPESRTPSEWADFYRLKMTERGLARSSTAMNLELLEKEFHSYFGASLSVFPHVLEDGQFAGDWLSNIVRRQRNAAHPLFHLLLQQFLDEKDVSISPFGAGPWPCLNPIVHHRSKLTIYSIQQHWNHGKKVAVFSCRCGYVYTRNYDPASQKIGPTRFLRYGPMFDVALKKFIKADMSLRGASRAFQLDPKTLIRLSQESGITLPWGAKKDNPEKKYKASTIQCRRRTKSPEKALATVQGKNRVPRRDWQLIDEKLLERVRREIREMHKVLPPIRISLSAIERRVSGCGWLSKRRHLLPKTTAFLIVNSETVAAFQVRRVRTVIREQARNDLPLRPWEIMRKAGLRSNALVWIKTEIDTSRHERRGA